MILSARSLEDGVALYCPTWVFSESFPKHSCLSGVYSMHVFCAVVWLQTSERDFILAMHIVSFVWQMTPIITWWWVLYSCRNSLLRQKSPCFDRKSPSGYSCCWTYPLYKIFRAKIAITWSVYKLCIQKCYKQRVLMHRHQGCNVRHGLCHIYMRYLYIWVVYSFCLFCCLFIIVTWWYMWCIVWQVASKRKYRHVW